MLILVKPDFAFQDGDLLHIADWKTVKSDAYWERIQVTCYALYAHQRWRVPLNRIVPQIAHLFPDAPKEETWNRVVANRVLDFGARRIGALSLFRPSTSARGVTTRLRRARRTRPSTAHPRAER